MSETRKQDHIELALSSRLNRDEKPQNFFKALGHYEPMLVTHPNEKNPLTYSFLGRNLGLPLWISSMTGGSEKAYQINKNLAMAAQEFSLPFALGSCRPLIESQQRLADFTMRKFIPDGLLMTNFGIAQVEEAIEQKRWAHLEEIHRRLEADIMIIHINPLQEWAQREGDRLLKSPLETLIRVLDQTKVPIMIKEVGQGFGPLSLQALLDLPIVALELAGSGGTNFTKCEYIRKHHPYPNLAREIFEIGHSCEEMLAWLNGFSGKKTMPIVISGGIVGPIQGLSLMKKCSHPSIFGMASELLKYAQGEYEEIQLYLREVQLSLMLAQQYLRVNGPL